MERKEMSIITKAEAIKQLLDLNIKYVQALSKAQQSDLALTSSKQALADAKEQIIISVDPKELGSNAEIREASLNVRLKDKVQELRELETVHSLNQLEVNISKSTVNVFHRIVDALSSASEIE
jgi:hypothetical protein